MLEVSIAPEVLENALRKGVTQPRVLVKEGLPAGATLWGLQMDHQAKQLKLYFLETGEEPEAHPKITTCPVVFTTEPQIQLVDAIRGLMPCCHLCDTWAIYYDSEGGRICKACIEADPETNGQLSDWELDEDTVKAIAAMETVGILPPAPRRG